MLAERGQAAGAERDARGARGCRSAARLYAGGCGFGSKRSVSLLTTE